MRANIYLRSVVIVILVLVISTFLLGSGVAPSAYNLIQSAGTPLAKESTLNFVNGGCVDNSGSHRTDCTVLTTVPANATCSFTSQTSVTCNHNLNTTAVVVSVYDAASPPNLIIPTTEKITDVNNVTVTFSSSQSGTVVVSGSSGSGFSGVSSVQTLTGAVTLFNSNPQTSTYQVLAADFTHCKTISVASGTFTVTLVASGSQPPDGQCVRILNYGSGVVTVARSGQNINGVTASQTLAAGSASAPTGLLVTSDGTNYFAQPLGAGGGGGGCSAGTWTAIPYAAAGPVIQDFGSGLQVGQYQIDCTNRVWLRGVVTCVSGGGVSANTTLFTLPAGFRPPNPVITTVTQDNGGNNALFIAQTGVVQNRLTWSCTPFSQFMDFTMISFSNF